MRKRSNGFWVSALTALFLEFGLVGMAIFWVIMHPPEDIQQVVPLVMSKIDSPKEEIRKQLKPPESPKLPIAVPQSKNLPSLSSLEPERRPIEEPVQPNVTKPTAFTTPVQPATVAPANPAPPLADPAVAYNLKLAAAVQAAFVVPGAATALGFKGRTRIEFQLKDGVVSNYKILQPSGLSAVDRAALKAVEVANFPAPPSALAGKEGIYQIWVACY